MKKCKRILILLLLGAALAWVSGIDFPEIELPELPFFHAQEATPEPEAAPGKDSYRYYTQPLRTEPPPTTGTETAVWSIR